MEASMYRAAYVTRLTEMSNQYESHLLALKGHCRDKNIEKCGMEVYVLLEQLMESFVKRYKIEILFHKKCENKDNRDFCELLAERQKEVITQSQSLIEELVKHGLFQEITLLEHSQHNMFMFDTWTNYNKLMPRGCR
jgi:hypothetical protein